MDLPFPGLARALNRLPELAALTLHAGMPAAVAWVPQLQDCTVCVQRISQMELLDRKLDADSVGQLPRLHTLKVHDERSQFAEDTHPPALIGLPLLPSLLKLVRGSSQETVTEA